MQEMISDGGNINSDRLRARLYHLPCPISKLIKSLSHCFWILFWSKYNQCKLDSRVNNCTWRPALHLYHHQTCVIIISPFQDGQTVLHLASGAGHLDTVEALLDRGCDANVQDFVSIVRSMRHYELTPIFRLDTQRCRGRPQEVTWPLWGHC